MRKAVWKRVVEMRGAGVLLVGVGLMLGWLILLSPVGVMVLFPGYHADLREQRLAECIGSARDKWVAWTCRYTFDDRWNAEREAEEARKAAEAGKREAERAAAERKAAECRDLGARNERGELSDFEQSRYEIECAEQIVKCAEARQQLRQGDSTSYVEEGDFWSYFDAVDAEFEVGRYCP